MPVKLLVDIVMVEPETLIQPARPGIEKLGQHEFREPGIPLPSERRAVEHGAPIVANILPDDESRRGSDRRLVKTDRFTRGNERLAFLFRKEIRNNEDLV